MVDIAIEEKRVQILQYLVNQKRLSVSSPEGGKDAQALLALEAVLKAMPESSRHSSNRATRKTKSSKMAKMGNQKILSKSYQSTLYNIQSDDESETEENELYDSFSCIDDVSHDAPLDDGLLTEDGNSRNDDESVSTTIKDPVRFSN